MERGRARERGENQRWRNVKRARMRAKDRG